MHIHFFESNCSFSAEKADNLICICSLKKQNIFKKKKNAYPNPNCSFMSFQLLAGVRKQQSEGCVCSKFAANLLSDSGTISVLRRDELFPLVLKCSQLRVFGLTEAKEQ